VDLGEGHHAELSKILLAIRHGINYQTIWKVGTNWASKMFLTLNFLHMFETEVLRTAFQRVKFSSVSIVNYLLTWMDFYMHATAHPKRVLSSVPPYIFFGVRRFEDRC